MIGTRCDKDECSDTADNEPVTIPDGPGNASINERDTGCDVFCVPLAPSFGSKCPLRAILALRPVDLGL